MADSDSDPFENHWHPCQWALALTASGIRLRVGLGVRLGVWAPNPSESVTSRGLRVIEASEWRAIDSVSSILLEVYAPGPNLNGKLALKRVEVDSKGCFDA